METLHIHRPTEKYTNRPKQAVLTPKTHFACVNNQNFHVNFQ